MAVDLLMLEPWLNGLLAKARPARRSMIMRRISVELRKRNAARIADQVNPAGSTYVPRITGGKPMFRKLRQRLIARSDDADAEVGFSGRDAALARVHQFGETSKVTPGGASYSYPVRALLGVPDDDRVFIEGVVMEMLT